LTAVAIVLVLYEVELEFDFTPAKEVKLPDPVVEKENERCFQQRDEEMHEVAFGTIDNPDVQKEFISANRDHIARECRQQYPERLITVQEPSRFNFVDIEPRFW